MYIPKFTKNIYTLFGIMICDVASSRAAFPILALVFFDSHSSIFIPQINQGIRSYWYAIAITAPNILALLTTPIFCSLSDHFGRKPLIMINLTGTSLASLISGLAVVFGSFIWLIAGIVFAGIFAHANPIAQAVIGDTNLGQRKINAMGWLQGFIAIGAFIGPILGSQLASWQFTIFNYSLAFFISSCFALAGLIVTSLLFNESLIAKNRSPTSNLVFQCLGLIKNRNIYRTYCIMANNI